MDIHKPKPWHGVREFLKEYLIIVIGVLTALGAEAVVERLHENRLSDEAKAAVRAEINVNLTNLARRAGPNGTESCIARRLDELEALLDRADATGVWTPPANVDTLGRLEIQTQRWDAAMAAGRASLLSSDEQRAFGRVYVDFARAAEVQRQQSDVWIRLRALAALRRLSPEMSDAARTEISQARDLDVAFQAAFANANVYAAQLAVKGDATLFRFPDEALRAARAHAICEPLRTLPPPNLKGQTHGHS